MNEIKHSLLLTTLLLGSFTFSHLVNATPDTHAETDDRINQTLIAPHGEITRDNDKLTLTWKNKPITGKTTIVWHDMASNRTGEIVTNIKNNTVTMNDPNPNRRTLFTLTDSNNNTFHLAERKIPAAGMDNFRDMGGYQTVDGKLTKWGVIYRADAFNKLAPSGYQYTANMNMAYIFDLRNDNEVSKKPNPSIDGITYYHTQIPDQPPKYADISWETTEAIQKFTRSPRAFSFYIDTNAFMVDDPKSHDSLKKIFTTALKAEGKGLVWHCAGGKDRTGFVSAVFLSALGVPDEIIINDYLLTNEYRKEFDKKELAEMSKAFNGDKKAIAGFLAIQQSRPEYIQASLDEINKKYGSMTHYLNDVIGINADQIAQLKHHYTE